MAAHQVRVKSLTGRLVGRRVNTDRRQGLIKQEKADYENSPLFFLKQKDKDGLLLAFKIIVVCPE